MNESDTRKNQPVLTFSRMNGPSLWLALGLVLTCVGLFFFVLGLFNLLHAQFWGLIAALFGAGGAYCGITAILWYLQKIEISTETVCLKLGHFTLRQIDNKDIQTVLGAAVEINRGWGERSLIILSTQTAEHMQQTGLAYIRKGPDFNNPYLRQGLNILSPKVQMNAYIDSKIIFLTLPRKEGLWLEFTQKRAEKIKEMFSNAEDFVS